jgi:hypothetical protein
MLQAEIITRPFTDMTQSETLLSVLMIIFSLIHRVKKRTATARHQKQPITSLLTYIPFNVRIAIRIRNKSHFLIGCFYVGLYFKLAKIYK